MIVKIREKDKILKKVRNKIKQLQNDVKFYTSFHNDEMALKNSDTLLKLEIEVNP